MLLRIKVVLLLRIKVIKQGGGGDGGVMLIVAVSCVAIVCILAAVGFLRFDGE
jgi:hypothetical protein